MAKCFAGLGIALQSESITIFQTRMIMMMMTGQDAKDVVCFCLCTRHCFMNYLETLSIIKIYIQKKS